MSEAPRTFPPAEKRHVSAIPFDELYGAKITRCLDQTHIPSVGVDYVEVPPNCELEPHVHYVAESYLMIVSGTATVTLDDVAHEVKAGDHLYVPPRVFHGFATNNDACVFYSIQCPPIYPTDGKVDIGFKEGTKTQVGDAAAAPPGQ
jgi:quercetin dioxygenase-like cupin family protein